MQSNLWAYIMFVILLHICRVYHAVQMLMQIRGNVQLVHLVSVIQTPTVLKLHLTCVPVTQPAATDVNAITDTAEMDLIAQVTHSRTLLKTDYDIVITSSAS